MKTLKFSPYLVMLILSGKKTSTWRLFDDKNLTTGDDLMLIDRSTGKEFAKATIVSIVERKFKDIGTKDFDGHETYKGEDEMYKVYQGYYKDQKITPETDVKIINFKLI